MSTNIVLTNQKGGVGKTTTTSAIACSLVERRNTKVLAIDLDPQGRSEEHTSELQSPS